MARQCKDVCVLIMYVCVYIIVYVCVFFWFLAPCHAHSVALDSLLCGRMQSEVAHYIFVAVVVCTHFLM